MVFEKVVCFFIIFRMALMNLKKNKFWFSNKNFEISKLSKSLFTHIAFKMVFEKVVCFFIIFRMALMNFRKKQILVQQ